MSSTRVKKSKLTASTPVIDRADKTRTIIESLESLSDSFKIASEVKPHPQPKKSFMIDLICEAICVIGVPRKGASYISIRKWILNHNETAASDARLVASLKRAFRTGLEKEVLGRPQKCKNVHGLTGSFVVLKKNPPKKEIPKKIMTEKTKTDNKTKAKAKSASNTQAANTANSSPTRTLNPSSSLVKKIKEKQTKATEKKNKNTKFAAIKRPNAGTSEVAAKRKLKVAIQRTPKKKTEALVIQTPNARLTKFAAKRTPKIVVQKTPKTKTSKVLVKKIPKATKLVGESKIAAKGTTKDKAIPARVQKPEPKEKSVNTKDQSKNISKERFHFRVKPPSIDSRRKDLSDTELEVKPQGRKSLKSYSSDTDINVISSNPIKRKRKTNKKITKEMKS